ncbi:sensor histidine kinase [hydrocarbon metagenome]|uniref:histidine kinase n=1 Tax=hydrocarbon metagenome TaxID=938273 RepID=A0A0W8E4F9_9ZZZZ
MKNSPLALQIWMIFVIITIGISTLFMLLVPWALRDFFTQQTYITIREAQSIYLSNGKALPDIHDITEWDQTNQQYQTVKHIVFLADGEVIAGSTSLLVFNNFDFIMQESRQQQIAAQQYSREINGEKMYYIIRKGELASVPVYLFSYTWESYQNDLVENLFSQLLWLIAIILLLSWMPSFLMARYITKPIIKMENHVRSIANRDWYESIDVDRDDEIGKLGQSIERMRQRLVEQEDMQRTFLQHISHELKTPVMVIRSYAQAIADGIFPKGGLEGSIEVIDKEASRMEKRVKDLLYLTKLDYLFSKRSSDDLINMGELIENIVELLRWQRLDLSWELELADIIFKGGLEQWQVAIENILDNQIRYANSLISITVSEHYVNKQPYMFIRIFNDGPSLEAGLIDKLFEEYQQGYKGEFGLGLAIVREIAVYHGGKIWAGNEEDGVAFYLDIPIRE